MTMTSRERVLKALNHQEADRVPLDLGATRNSGLLVPTYKKLAHYLDLTDYKTGSQEHGHSKLLGLATPSEEILKKLNIDFRGITLGKADTSNEALLSDGTHRDELGVIRRQPDGVPYWDLTISPFSGDVTIEDIKKWDWPDPTDPGHTRGLRKKALTLREKTNYAIVLHLQDIIVHPSQFLLGFEKWYLSFYMEPKLISVLMDIMLELRLEVTQRALEEVRDLIDVVSCSDDICDARGCMLSPQMYNEFIKSRHSRYFSLIRSLTNAKILYHSCGAVSKLIPSFIDMGIDFINPVQVSANGMDTKQLKTEYGDKIGFWGGIDTTQVLPFGTPNDVIEEVKMRIHDLAVGGGYVLAAVHNIQPDVSAENIVAMYDAAIKYGCYPSAK
jgi:uroporphyrinogen decarboxylase